MNRSSVKRAVGASKAARKRPTKKSVKNARSAVKKSSKSSKTTQRSAAKSARTVAVRSPSVAPKAILSMIRTASPPMQPVAAGDVLTKTHKYQVGETVYYTSPSFGRAAATGSYTVVKLLPSEGDDYQYRIKSQGEAFERVAKESQLDRA